jgi:hypothetical protein
MARGQDRFSADIAALERGGVNIKHLATLAASIYGDLFNVTDKYGKNLGGNGDIGKSLEKNYYPSADASLRFLKDLKDLVDTHGGKTIALGGLFGDVNTTATGEAGNYTGHRH